MQHASTSEAFDVSDPYCREEAVRGLGQPDRAADRCRDRRNHQRIDLRGEAPRQRTDLIHKTLWLGLKVFALFREGGPITRLPGEFPRDMTTRALPCPATQSPCGWPEPAAGVARPRGSERRVDRTICGWREPAAGASPARGEKRDECLQLCDWQRPAAGRCLPKWSFTDQACRLSR